MGENLPVWGDIMKLIRLAAAASFFACTSFSLASAETELKLWNLTSSSDAVNKHWEEVIATFEEAHPGIKINYETFPSDAYKTGLQVALASDAGPDIFFNWSGEDAAVLARNGLTADLTEIGANPGMWGEKIAPGMFDAFTVGGKIHGVPTHLITKYMFYNTSFFADNNLSVPTTLGELKASCKAIRDINPRMSPISLGNAEKWKGVHYISTLNQKIVGEAQVAKDYALDGNAKELFSDPGYVEALQTLVDLSQAGCFNKAPNATTADASRSLFAAGQAAMIYCGNWCPGTFDSEGLEGGYDLARFPAAENGKGNQDYNFALLEGYQISARTKNMDAASTFVNFLVSGETQAKRARDFGRLPVNASHMGEEDGTPIFRKIAKDAGSYAGLVLILDVGLEKSVSEHYLSIIQEVLNETKTPEQAMGEIRARAQKAKEQQG
ncbi:carbohydrate ABC transporter substrate-binding protein, CUT1 family [Pseudovibrio denitrificans]|uniref:Carbohydrate ABC transporter substrate-binding protein, CUT1 family n=2 Tax=Pseudovibrio denitrificans TaxID=258256 RepID=A0A1I7D1U2_9HYPH|nr:carbohydrate ABC transporter substrate-binding protein, CUT1 family [Pseudovibrio denitrificans]